MPNWSEGSLKLRGKREDIIKFLKSFEKAKDRDNQKYIPDTLRAFFIEDEYTLNEYLEMSKTAHTPHTLSCALAMHEEFLKSGDMRNTKWENYKR